MCALCFGSSHRARILGYARGTFDALAAPLSSLAFLVAVAFPQFMLAQGYQAEGVLHVSIVAGSKTIEMREAFSAAVRNEAFLISVARDPSDRMECGFDGEDMYTVFYAPPSSRPVPTKAPVPSKVAPRQPDRSQGEPRPVDNSATIESRTVPGNTGSYSQYIWLAYASGRYFQALTNNLLPPIWTMEDPRTRAHPFMVRAQFITNGAPPGLPSYIEYVTDGIHREYHPGKQSLIELPLPPPFDGGFTNAVYEVRSWTNVGGMTLPTWFTFTVFSSPLAGPPIRRLIVQGSPSAIRTALPNSDLLPRAPGVVSVADHRFHGSVPGASASNIAYPFIRYRVTNGMWLGRAELISARSRHEKRLLRIEEAETGQTRMRVAPVLTVMALVLLTLPLCFVLLRRLKHKTHNSTARTDSHL